MQFQAGTKVRSYQGKVPIFVQLDSVLNGNKDYQKKKKSISIKPPHKQLINGIHNIESIHNTKSILKFELTRKP